MSVIFNENAFFVGHISYDNKKANQTNERKNLADRKKSRSSWEAKKAIIEHIIFIQYNVSSINTWFCSHQIEFDGIYVAAWDEYTKFDRFVCCNERGDTVNDVIAWRWWLANILIDVAMNIKQTMGWEKLTNI